MGLGLQGAVLLLGACGGADVRTVGESGEEAAHFIKARKQRNRQWPEANHVLQKHRVAYFFTDAPLNGLFNCELIERLVY